MFTIWSKKKAKKYMIYTQTGFRTNELIKADLPDDNNPLDNILSLQQTVKANDLKDIKKFKANKAHYFISGELKEVNGKYIRNKDNFISKDIAILDYDNIGNVTLKEFTKDILEYDFLAYPTPSHTPENSRYRVIIPFDRFIYDEETYHYNINFISGLIKGYEYDQSSKTIVQLQGLPLTIDPEPIRNKGNKWQVLDPKEDLAYNSITDAQRLSNGKIAVQGERNKALFSKACSLRTKGYEEDQIINELRLINSKQITPPISDREIITIAKSASKYKTKLEQNLSDLNLYEDVERVEEPSDHANVISTERRQLYLPDVKIANNGAQTYKATISNMESILEWLNLEVYYDIILKRTFIKTNEHTPKDILYSTRNLNILTTYILSLCEKIDFSISDKKIFDYLINISHKNRRNIPLEKLKKAYAKYPDNTDEINKMLECFEFSDITNKDHDTSAIKKWLSQVCAMACNDNGTYGAEYALCLVGKQGIGKTTFGKVLCSEFFGQEYFKEGIMLSDDKDNKIESTGCLIGEIGELSKSLRDINFLKNFITSKEDNYRKPYAREDEIYPRNSCYYMTTNEVEFLRDTENRRFYVVDIIDIDLDKFSKLNFEAIWSEAYDNWLTYGQRSFRPTKEEQAANEKIVRDYRDQSKEERLLNELFQWNEPRESWIDYKVSSIAQIIKNVTGFAYDPRQIGKALRAIGYEFKNPYYTKKRIQGENFYTLPHGIDGLAAGIGIRKNEDN